MLADEPLRQRGERRPLAFAAPPGSKMMLTDRYSYRLMRNFYTRDFCEDITAANRPLALIAAGNDALMLSDQYQGRVPVLIRHHQYFAQPRLD